MMIAMMTMTTCFDTELKICVVHSLNLLEIILIYTKQPEFELREVMRPMNVGSNERC